MMSKYMISIFILLLSVSASADMTSSDADASNSTKNESLISKQIQRKLTLNYVQWNEKISLQNSSANDDDYANFVGTNFGYEKNVLHPLWGWGLGVTLGTGKATGGGNSTLITYQKGNQAWTSLGGIARAFYRASEKANIGFAVPIVYRQIKWPDNTGGYPVDSGKNINTGFLLSTEFRITQKLGFSQEFGPFSSSSGATLWRIGINYLL